ncbi:lysine exporter LysO family protein [Sulfolobus acidocaldarius]|uniref:Uncharacterized protein n=3 Tax=Sulfolobus acidocaldarius TaxID=2285 RepID=A0A0U3HAX4_9CREN|nr:lysine exporter LysO family protein [Sulfolobus acidocaldarius]AGE70208.1 hypothetical protein SacN8_01135 [Sulfolobus acidocaldarius N8]AGE72483.1 hypothetical protein SacRon12I_01135 [Sulfolobus acidocaldarius Ron12/I]ALU29383.1 hypothetical protein ATY89_05110 [Sulfolobus acidocaldarius]ALU32112.1 hypothetical protein ATZ20_08135 [Sulfolobus acidocaldarius]WCM34226.1 DUF340 domain-containing protein [Sulfolobus acidocaldarius DSM 639]
MFTEVFISVYVIALILGRYIKLPKGVSDAIILTVIFTIAFWGGSQIAGIELVDSILLSLLLALVITVVTYALGLFTVSRLNVTFATKVNWKVQAKYLIPLVLGFVVGLLLRVNIPFGNIIDYELYILALVIGIDVGSAISLKTLMKMSKVAIFAVIIDVISAVLVALIISPVINLKEGLMIMLGSGWYSYTGPFVARYYGPVAGIIGFLVNFLREQLAFVLVPIFLKFRPTPVGAIAVGGATSMDVTLPLYVEVLGNEYMIGAMVSGVILTIAVPIILPLVSII